MNNKKDINSSIIFYIAMILMISGIWILLRMCGFFTTVNIFESSFPCAILLLIYRLSLLRYFKMDVSETILSVKYNYPVGLYHRGPVLEIPIEKLSSFIIEKGIFSNFLILSIKTKRGIRNYYYRLGVLKKQKIDKTTVILNNILLKNDSRL